MSYKFVLLCETGQVENDWCERVASEIKRERVRERDRQRERQTQRETDRERDRQTERQTERVHGCEQIGLASPK
jgi:hypothetical protein